MASLQIPFSRWDWPNSETLNEGGVDTGHTSSISNHPESQSPCHNYSNSHGHHSHSKSPKGHHRLDVLNCSHSKSNPIAASLSSLSAMLLEGQAVLAHQTPSAIWLFIGLSNGSIWKWSINLVRPALPYAHLYYHLLLGEFIEFCGFEGLQG